MKTLISFAIMGTIQLSVLGVLIFLTINTFQRIFSLERGRNLGFL
jgi:hypothetical protein